MSKDVTHVKMSWPGVNNACHAIAMHILGKTAGVDRIIGISRGGSVPAVILSHILKVPTLAHIGMHWVSDEPDSHCEIHAGHAHPESWDSSRTLIVDDIYDSGRTTRMLQNIYPSSMFVVLASKHKEPPGIFMYHTLYDPEPWVIFPWENVAAQRG
jgi:hypoxanthine phosphoribosyltransferase